jgi:hypothetical protein
MEALMGLLSKLKGSVRRSLSKEQGS